MTKTPKGLPGVSSRVTALFKMGLVAAGSRGTVRKSPRRKKAAGHAADAQLALAFPAPGGGARRGAGRKRAQRGNVPRRARPRHRAAEPFHVTLRSKIAPRDHLHLIVEASDKRALSSGVRSVAIRVARYVNGLLSRRGPLWADRWHGRTLTSPREVRNALLYVLANFRKHAERVLAPGIDAFASAAWFDGWRGWGPGLAYRRPSPRDHAHGSRGRGGRRRSSTSAR